MVVECILFTMLRKQALTFGSQLGLLIRLYYEAMHFQAIQYYLLFEDFIDE